MQDFLEDWAVGRIRGKMMGVGWGGLGDRHSTGASSVSYRHNFLVNTVLWNTWTGKILPSSQFLFLHTVNGINPFLPRIWVRMG